MSSVGIRFYLRVRLTDKPLVSLDKFCILLTCFLLFTDKWSNEYFSPVGVDDGPKESKVWIFNPSTAAIEVNVETLFNTTTVTVPAGEAVRTNFSIPSGSGVRLTTGNINKPNGTSFFALTQTDIEDPDDSTTFQSGQREDWGHPLIPLKSLTPLALVGVGW